MESFALLLAATFNAGTVLAIAARGLPINVRAGIATRGAAGRRRGAAIAGFATAVHTGNDWLAFAAGAGAGALMAAAFGVLVIWLNTNQYATGLALSLFGTGFSAFAGIKYTQEKLAERAHFDVPFLSDIPFIGPAVFRQHPMVYLAVLFTIALAWFLYRSRAGLVLRAVGESPESAHALGYPVRRIRLLAVVVGGALFFFYVSAINEIFTSLYSTQITRLSARDQHLQMQQQIHENRMMREKAKGDRLEENMRDARTAEDREAADNDLYDMIDQRMAARDRDSPL